MSEAPSLPLADTSDMLGVHRVFRNAFEATPRFIGAVDPDDAERAEVVGAYYANVLDLLHSHHDGEDLLLTPRLMQRCTPDEAAEVRRIAAQHQDVVEAIAAAEGSLAAWRAEPSAGNRAQLIDALDDLQSRLATHLDEEEQVVLPVAGRYINVAEWGELPSHAMQNYRGDKLWLIMGLIREQMTPAQVANMEANMPPPVFEFWQSTGQGLFTDYIATLRG